MAADLADPAWQSRLEPLLAGGTAAGANLVEVFVERTDHLGALADLCQTRPSNRLTLNGKNLRS
jgi:hypothetical protein